MREATAEHARHRLLDLFVARPGILVQKSFGGHDDAAHAEAALRRLLIDERLLNRVGLFDAAQTFERCDFDAVDGLHRRDAGPHGLALDDDRTGAALTQPAAKLRPAQLQIVA